MISVVHKRLIVAYLVLNTSRSVAEDTLTQDRDGAAAGTLTDGRADSGEFIRSCRDGWGIPAVEVSQSENISCTALRSAIKATAGDVDLTVLNLSGSGGGHASNGGNDGSGEELHLDV